MGIFIVHPGTGTVLDLSECVVMDREPSGRVGDSALVERHLDLDKAGRPRTYLLAVAEREQWEDGTRREVVVLNTADGDSQMFTTSGEPVRYFDNVHDLFLDVF